MSYPSGFFSISLGAVYIFGLLNLGKYIYPPTGSVDADLWSRYVILRFDAELVAIVDGRPISILNSGALGQCNLLPIPNPRAFITCHLASPAPGYYDDIISLLMRQGLFLEQGNI